MLNKIVIGVVLLSVVLVAISFYKEKSKQRNEELRLYFLESVVSDELLSYSNLEIPSLNYLRVVEEESGPALSLRTSNEELVNGLVRAEVSVDFPFLPGDTLRYSWEYKIDEDLYYAYDEDDPNGKWWIIGQWHDQPNINKGETWDNFPANSPPVILGFGKFNNKDSLSFSYGVPSNQKTPIVVPFTKGVWHSFELNIKWSQGNDGWADLYLNGEKIASFSGPNMLNDYQHYFKIGSYRKDTIVGDGWVYVRNVAIEKIDM